MNSRGILILLFFLLSSLVLVSFVMWGEGYEEMFSLTEAEAFFQERAHWAGPLGAGLLIADLVLPVPSTGILGGMGAALGFGPAFLWGWAGLVLSGCVGYGAALAGGQILANRLASPEEQVRYRHLFNTWGGTALIVSRMLPILPEVLSVLSGLYRMRFTSFLVANLLGSIPPAVIYTWLGATSRDDPAAALWGFVGITLLAWLLYLALRRRHSTLPERPGDGSGAS